MPIGTQEAAIAATNGRLKRCGAAKPTAPSSATAMSTLTARITRTEVWTSLPTKR